MAIKLTVQPDLKRKTRFVYELDQREVLVGRDAGCHVRLPFPFVSAHHLTIISEGAGYLVVDNGATNETTLNDQLLPSHSFSPLRDGDQIQLAHVRISVAVGSISTVISIDESSEYARSMVQGVIGDGKQSEVALEVTEGPDAGKRVVIPDGKRRFTIGRGARCDLTLTDERCHDRHLLLDRQGEGYSASPLDEQICRLNGEVLMEARSLGHEAQLSVGQTTLRFVDPLRGYLAQLAPDSEGAAVPQPIPQRRPTERLDELSEMLSRKAFATTAPLNLGPPDRPPVLQKPQLDRGSLETSALPELREDRSRWGSFEYAAFGIVLVLFLAGLVVGLMLFNVI